MPLLGIKRSGPDSRQVGTGPAGSVPRGKTDLLLRFFDSNFFDEWIALTYVPVWTLLMLQYAFAGMEWLACVLFLDGYEIDITASSKRSYLGGCVPMRRAVVSVQVPLQEQFPRRAGLPMQSTIQSLRGWSGEILVTAVPIDYQQTLWAAREGRGRPMCSKSPHRCEGA